MDLEAGRETTTINASDAPSAHRRHAAALRRRRGRPFTVGLVAGGLGAYWPQFPTLRPELERQAARVAARLRETGCDLVEAGFISDEVDASQAAEQLRRAGCDLVVVDLATYLTSTMVVPIAEQSGAPLLVLALQPTPAMDHAHFGTAEWLAYCGACALPEVANALQRCRLPFRSVSGHLEDPAAWVRIHRYLRSAEVRAALRHGRFGLLGHLYPGMYDVSTDITLVPAQLGGHVEVLELDDLMVRAAAADDDAVDVLRRRIEETFTLDASAGEDDLAAAARMAAGLERLVDDFDLDTLAYYYRGLDGNDHERAAAGLIAGASLLTAAGVPACGEFELRTSLAMLIVDRLGAGGSFTEIQALNFTDRVVEMGHDGPGHLAIAARRPLLRGLGVYHGKRGYGVSVEFDVRPGPVTLVGLTQGPEGRFRLVVSEGQAVDGPHLAIGNTTTRVDMGTDPGEWCDRWAATGMSHHWALGVGHLAADLACVADLIGMELVVV
jgi:L-arabinose isomerase